MPLKLILQIKWWDNSNEKMEDLSGINVDISELISQLQHEKLLVNGEKDLIREYNEKLSVDTENLLRIAWINLQQRVNLNALVGSCADSTPEQCCRKAASLTNSVFLPAKKVFDYQIMLNYSSFLSWLHSKPEQVAQWIVIGEALIEDQKAFSGILQSIVSGFYGSLLLPQDTSLMLNLLHYLAKLQLVTTDNPRRLLKQRSCAFSQMYFLFHEGLISAKLFLISALQTPILKLIATSGTYLDIDPSKTLARLSSSERQQKFGTEGTEIYKMKVSQYRKWVVKNLSELAKLFISSLQDNIYCFPSTLTWLIRQIANMISKSFNPHSKEINAISTDLIFTLFICPAIIQPEPYGICDAPISEIARHNLIQVGQILQMLALLKFETPDVKLMDLYKMFEDDCISNILDVILNDNECDTDHLMIENVPGVQRTVALFTEQELYNLIMFFKKAQNSILQDHHANGESSMDFCSNNADNATSLPSDPLVVLLNKLPTESDSSPTHSYNNNNNNNISPTKKNHILNKAKSHILRPSNGDLEECPINVIVIPLQSETDDHIGLLAEQKVLAMNATVEETLLIDVTDAPSRESVLVVNGNLSSGLEKRTRFSHNDEGSIGNTSDNLEVISEAASNHSVASSIELETEDQNDNDNLSDMVSANVSGRGSPNISGRDTPSSQVTENEDNRPLAEPRPPYLQQPQPQIIKQIRSEIDDKFCKFEIKKLLQGDETISIISDTWSTDVLASDSETIDANESRQDAQNFSPIIEQPNLDASETQSESAWSTDVLASDTERLTEVDNDDIMSVAPSDDTASIARSDDAASVAPSERSELDEQNLNDRRLSIASSTNHFATYQSSQNNSPSAFQEYSRIDVNARRESMPNYSTKSEHRESYERVYISTTTTESSILRPMSRNCLETSKREAIIFDQKPPSDPFIKRPILIDISNNLDVPGPSGLIKNIDQQKYDDIRTDMQLSNTSLNSSSSGSSSNSSEMQNKNSSSESSWKNKIWMNGSESNLNIISSATEGGNKKLSIQRSKPNPSTGAIPKSISFDMSAEKTYKEIDEDSKSKRGGFFGKFRISNFRPKRGKSIRGLDDCANGARMENVSCDDDSRFRKPSDYVKSINPVSATELSEDILAKYRTKHTNENGPTNLMKSEKVAEIDDAQLLNLDDSISLNNLFNDTKKKLRLVLSNSKTHHFKINKDGKKHVKKDLESFLQLELAKARDLKQWSIAARVAEALRCVRLLDIGGFNKLCEDLKSEYSGRSVYLQYLLKSKQILLSSQAFLDELLEQVRREQESCGNFLVSVCVRLFLDIHEQDLQRFCTEFKRLTLVDEKNDLLLLFLKDMYKKMKVDVFWDGASDEQIQIAQLAIERSVMTEVYVYALFPNGDGDRHRDSLLNEHLKKLASTITPSHKYIMINKMYQNECPWLPAQEALQAMAAYRTPREKVVCVSRCASAIMDLLSLAQTVSTTADDLMPVLVYVIIQANPQDLLSTMQYVNSFFGNSLTGEDMYWWTQFCAAVEYTKNLEYTD